MHPLESNAPTTAPAPNPDRFPDNTARFQIKRTERRRVGEVVTGQINQFRSLLTQAAVSLYCNNRLDCGTANQEMLEGEQSLGLTSDRPPRGESTYLLPAGHPAAEGGHEDGAEQDLSRMVDQQRDRDEGQMLVALKHNLQHGDPWRHK